MKKRIKVVLFVGSAILAGIQVVRPSRTTAPGDPLGGFPGLHTSRPEVASILTRACADCHSEQTHWPWYSNVAPVSWFVADHVRDARRHFNMSAFATYDEERKREKLTEICEEVSEGGMPLRSYLLIHWSSRLTPPEVAMLCSWTREAAAASVSGGKPAVAVPADEGDQSVPSADQSAETDP